MRGRYPALDYMAWSQFPLLEIIEIEIIQSNISNYNKEDKFVIQSTYDKFREIRPLPLNLKSSTEAFSNFNFLPLLPDHEEINHLVKRHFQLAYPCFSVKYFIIAYLYSINFEHEFSHYRRLLQLYSGAEIDQCRSASGMPLIIHILKKVPSRLLGVVYRQLIEQGANPGVYYQNKDEMEGVFHCLFHRVLTSVIEKPEEYEDLLPFFKLLIGSGVGMGEMGKEEE